MKKLLEEYFENMFETFNRDDAREESYYEHLKWLMKEYAKNKNIENIDITVLPKRTEGGNPDFRIWDGANHITGYMEAKAPFVTNLDNIENSEQLKRYRFTFPNVILTDFYEFRLYRDGKEAARAVVGRSFIQNKLHRKPLVENIDELEKLLDLFFSFSLPKVETASLLALELAKRTRFLREEVISVEMREKEETRNKKLAGFFEAFKEYLIGTLTEEEFADLYAQTVT